MSIIGGMAIIRKKFGNRVYLYEAVCKRVNGKPRIVSQKYLGKPEDVLGLPKKESKASSARIYDFGAVTPLLDIANDLKIIQVIDGVVRKRKQGLSVRIWIKRWANICFFQQLTERWRRGVKDSFGVGIGRRCYGDSLGRKGGI